MPTQQTTTEVRTVKAGNGALVLRLYRKAKRIEKNIEDALKRYKGSLFSLYPVPTHKEEKLVIVEGEQKLATISMESKRIFDETAFKEKHPDINLESFLVDGKPYLVIRLH